MDKNKHTLINQHSNELAFKMYRFDDLHHFDHIQRLSYYSLIWVQEGAGKVIMDFNSYPYSDNYLFSFTPYQPFMFDAQTPTKGIIIHFHNDFFCIHKHHQEVSCNGVLFNNIYEPPFVVIDPTSVQTMNLLIDGMEKDIERNQLAMHESVLSYLKLFLINCSRLKNDQNPQLTSTSKETTAITQKLKDLIETDYRTKHSPKQYAEALNITPKALAKISKQHFNKTLTTLISERIIIEAKRELYLTDKPIKEIAAELGYDDEFYFSRFFKKNTNITPSFFRKTVGFHKA